MKKDRRVPNAVQLSFTANLENVVPAKQAVANRKNHYHQ